MGITQQAPSSTTSASAMRLQRKCDCNDHAMAESARLLRHEQEYFAIACVITRKAQDALDRGGDFDRLLRIARQKLRQTQNRNNNQTRPGCIAAQQRTRETSIANNLPTITIP